jgi:hypothetical protein
MSAAKPLTTNERIIELVCEEITTLNLGFVVEQGREATNGKLLKFHKGASTVLNSHYTSLAVHYINELRRKQPQKTLSEIIQDFYISERKSQIANIGAATSLLIDQSLE